MSSPATNTTGAPAGTTTTTSNPGRGNRRQGRGHGGPGRGNDTQNRTQQSNAHRRTNAFRGGIAKMNGHVFQCYGEATEKSQYTRTVEELEVYIGAHFKAQRDRYQENGTHHDGLYLHTTKRPSQHEVSNG